MKLVFLILALVAIISAVPKWSELSHEYKFEHYQQHFDKVYNCPRERAFRQSLFNERLSVIMKHNADETQTWKMGVNKFTDKTPEELKAYLGLNKGIIYGSKALMEEEPVEEIDMSALPTNVDWRLKGAVTAVKDQGQCGSCWSFAAAEALESMWFLTTGELPLLSEQNILDCTPNPNHCGGTGGCQGATVELAFDMVKENGISSEWTYPYISYSGNNYNCTTGHAVAAKISGYKILAKNQLGPLMQAVANEGPVAISVDASKWFLYESGVFDGCNQKNPDIDHAVQLVGYGTDEKLGDYWLVRNSWSPTWGERGYIRVKRTATPRCGVDITPEDGDGCTDGPPTVDVCGTCGILYDSVIPYYNK